MEEARRIVGTGAIVGVSTHDEAQIAAAAGTSGDLHRRRTDLRHGDEGHRATARAASTWCGTPRRRRDRPVVAIGGITLERAPEVMAAGAASVAVISDLLRGRSGAMVRRFSTRRRNGGPTSRDV